MGRRTVGGRSSAATGTSAEFSGDGGTCTPSTLEQEWNANRSRRVLADPVTVTEAANTALTPAVLDPGATFNGTVTDSVRALGIATVTVTVFDVGVPMFTTCTAGNGTYSITRIPDLVLTIKFDANGSCGNAGNHAPQWWQNSDTEAGADFGIYSTGQTVNNLNAALSAPPAGRRPSRSPARVGQAR